MKIFRYLAPSPPEIKAFYALAFGSFMGQCVAFVLAISAPNALAGAIAVGGGLAIMARFFYATWQFDVRRRRAGRGGVELSDAGLKIVSGTGGEKFVKWDEITQTSVKNGRLEIRFRGEKWRVGARELQNGMAFVEEVARRTQKKSNFIPLSPR